MKLFLLTESEIYPSLSHKILSKFGEHFLVHPLSNSKHYLKKELSEIQKTCTKLNGNSEFCLCVFQRVLHWFAHITTHRYHYAIKPNIVHRLKCFLTVLNTTFKECSSWFELRYDPILKCTDEMADFSIWVRVGKFQVLPACEIRILFSFFGCQGRIQLHC